MLMRSARLSSGCVPGLVEVCSSTGDWSLMGWEARIRTEVAALGYAGGARKS